MSIGRFFRSVPRRAITPVKTLSTTAPIEEEHAPRYRPDSFYPTRLFDILNNRYQIAAKLG